MEETPKSAKRLPAGKIVVALILIIFGSVLVLASVVYFSQLAAPERIALTSITSTRNGAIPIDVNKTMEVGIAFMNSGTLHLSWTAAAPILIYVLNEIQYANISSKQVNAIRPYFLEPPVGYIRNYFNATGEDSLTLPMGNYHLLASASAPTVLNELNLSYPAVELSESPFSSGLAGFLPYAIAGAGGAIGVLLIVLGLLILAKRFWISQI